MFINLLNSQQQSALLYLAHRLVHLDGDFSEQELDKLDGLRKECNYKVEIGSGYSDQDLKDLFNSDVAKRVLILELFLLGYSDDLDQTELDSILDLGALLELDQANLVNYQLTAQHLAKLKDYAFATINN